MSVTGEYVANRCLSPELAIYESSECLQEFSEKKPFLSRVIFISLAPLNALIKTVLFPLITAIGTVVLPLIGLIRACLQKGDGMAYVKGGAWCLLGFLSFATFAMVSAYYLPLPVSGLIFVIAVASCIAYHVHRASSTSYRVGGKQ